MMTVAVSEAESGLGSQTVDFFSLFWGLILDQNLHDLYCSAAAWLAE